MDSARQSPTGLISWREVGAGVEKILAPVFPGPEVESPMDATRTGTSYSSSSSGMSSVTAAAVTSKRSWPTTGSRWVVDKSR